MRGLERKIEHYSLPHQMKQVKFTTALYFDVPESVTPEQQIRYLDNALHVQKELLLLKVQDINIEGKWEVV